MSLQNYIEQTFLKSEISYYVKEKNGKYASVNQAFLDEYNMTSSHEVLGQNDIDLWNGDAPLFHINDHKVMLSNKPGVYIEDMIFKSKKQFYLSCKGPFYSHTGKIIGVFGISFPLNNQSFDGFSEKLAEPIQLFQSGLNKGISNTLSKVKLSNRQKECLHFLARGMTIKEIASALKLSPKTIENYFAVLKLKLNCFTRAELVNKAFEYNLI